MTEESLDQAEGSSNLKQADSILQKTSGKLEIAIEAMRSGGLNENAQFGLKAILCEIKDEVDRTSAILAFPQADHTGKPTTKSPQR